MNVRTAPCYRVPPSAKPRGRPLSTASVIYIGAGRHKDKATGILPPIAVKILPFLLQINIYYYIIITVLLVKIFAINVLI